MKVNRILESIYGDVIYGLVLPSIMHAVTKESLLLIIYDGDASEMKGHDHANWYKDREF
jgi:hypothetical protein